jgi:ribose transport system substrate-binding protein
MSWSKRIARLSVALALMGATLVVAACGGSDSASESETTAVDVGSGTVDIATEPTDVAMFVAGSASGYTFTAALEKGAEKAASENGMKVEFFEANFDPAAQYSQVQSALASGKYDAFVIQPTSPQLCKLLRDAAVENDVLVTVIGATLCGQDHETGDKLWSPGTLTYVGGQYGVPGFTAYVEDIVADNPGPQKAIQVIGPKEFGVTRAWFEAVDPIYEANPQFDVVATVYTDYTTPDAFRKTQDALQGNPDVGIVISQYGDLTRGVVRAADALERDDLKIYDFGGSAESVDLMDKGKVQATFATYPRSMGSAAIEAIVAAAAGEEVPRFIEKDGNPDGLESVLDSSDVRKLEPQF